MYTIEAGKGSDQPKTDIGEKINKVAIIGAGAVGGYFIQRLSQFDPECLSVIAGAERGRRLKRKGLIINGKYHELKVVGPQEINRAFDLIIVAVKFHHLDQVINDIIDAVASKTIILSVMNGLGSEERIGSVFGMERILYGSIVGISACKKGNEITFSEKTKVYFGERKNCKISDHVRLVQDLFEKASIKYEIPVDMIRNLWWKFMINVGINQVEAVTGMPRYATQLYQEAKELMFSAMEEVIAIANFVGIDLNKQDMDSWHDFLMKQAPEAKTSMLQDIQRNRKTEVDIFSGKVRELGIKYGITTPVNDTLYRIIKVLEKREFES